MNEDHLASGHGRFRTFRVEVQTIIKEKED